MSRRHQWQYSSPDKCIRCGATRDWQNRIPAMLNGKRQMYCPCEATRKALEARK